MSSKIAVAMSLYKSDRIDNVNKAIYSILNQSFSDLVLFLQVDGSINEEVKELVSKYSLDDRVKVFFNEENKGLAYRLNAIIDLVVDDPSFAFIARMDADDIARNDRFQLQVDFLLKNAHISVIGSDVIEIDESDRHVFYKSMDSEHSVMYSRIIKKCPFNHPSVMFRKSVFESGIRYDSKLKNTQDYYLWVDLIKNGFEFSNINEPLLYFRVDSDFHNRRGFDKAMNDVKSRMYAFKNLNNISASNLMHVALLFFLRIAPPKIKEIAYKKFR
ncbi:glycosyltransferase [Vibrio fluvialis]|nr:glycosyltransferase [Vibrio fluvialis]